MEETPKDVQCSAEAHGSQPYRLQTHRLWRARNLPSDNQAIRALARHAYREISVLASIAMPSRGRCGEGVMLKSNLTFGLCIYVFHSQTNLSSSLSSKVEIDSASSDPNQLTTDVLRIGGPFRTKFQSIVPRKEVPCKLLWKRPGGRTSGQQESKRKGCVCIQPLRPLKSYNPCHQCRQIIAFA